MLTGACAQFVAGIMLSFGGLLSEIIQGGSPAINTANPGLLKVLGGFVFPVGLVMCVSHIAWRSRLRPRRHDAGVAARVRTEVERTSRSSRFISQDRIGGLRAAY